MALRGPIQKYNISIDDINRCDRNHSYHAPKEDQPERYVEIRKQAREFERTLLMFCPPSRERSIAQTKLEECVMWANASIARNE